MDICRKSILLNGRNDEYRIDVYGDTHVGSRNFDETLLKKHVNATLLNGNSWCFVDDAIDGITPDDRKRWNYNNVESWVLADPSNVIYNECRVWKELFTPIQEQCLFTIVGQTSHYQTGYIADPIREMLHTMGITHYTGAVYLRLSFSRSEKSRERKLIDLVFAHGDIAGRTDSAKIIALERVLECWGNASGYFCGHGHTKVQTPPQSILYVEGNKIKSRYKRAAMTGSYLLTYHEGTTGYGEKRMYKPVALGHITIVLRPWCKDDQKVLEIENG